jgi:hypothetical protein
VDLATRTFRRASLLNRRRTLLGMTAIKIRHGSQPIIAVPPQSLQAEGG